MILRRLRKELWDVRIHAASLIEPTFPVCRVLLDEFKRYLLAIITFLSAVKFS
jgi:hypothetical protein